MNVFSANALVMQWDGSMGLGGGYDPDRPHTTPHPALIPILKKIQPDDDLGSPATLLSATVSLGSWLLSSPIDLVAFLLHLVKLCCGTCTVPSVVRSSGNKALLNQCRPSPLLFLLFSLTYYQN